MDGQPALVTHYEVASSQKYIPKQALHSVALSGPVQIEHAVSHGSQLPVVPSAYVPYKHPPEFTH